MTFTAKFARLQLSGACLAAGLAMVLGSGGALAEDIKLRIASGHPAVNTYVNLMQNFFVPEVTKKFCIRLT